MQRVEKKSIIIWILEDFQSFIIRMAFIAVLYYFFHEYDFVLKIILLLAIYFTWNFLIWLIFNPLRYRNFRFSIDDNVIQTVKGGIIIQHDTIPIRRIQHVDIEQTFYSRFFHLYCLSIYTAGHDHFILYLTEQQAQQVKTDIVTKLIEEGIDQDEHEKRSPN
ncbi:PH domain-containing protein [Sporosarcina sp. FSL K6-1522]|uniref:PH domain-containing protein n=1 Tax=Sporosarcina sp. FSL K6-1522 TaxID=2921554 RepID=UPI00315A1E8D